jgi:hypothetical protein
MEVCTFPNGTWEISSISVTPGRMMAPLKYPPYANSATISTWYPEFITQQIKRILHKMIGNIHCPIPYTVLLQSLHHFLRTILENIFLIQQKLLRKGGADKSSHSHCVLGFLRRENIVRTSTCPDHTTEIRVFVPWQVGMDSRPSLLGRIDRLDVYDVGCKTNDRTFPISPKRRTWAQPRGEGVTVPYF